MSDQRSPAEVAGGYILVALGGETRQMPTLKIKDERAFREFLVRTIGDIGLDVDVPTLKAGGESAYNALGPLAGAPSEVMLNLVLAYDKTAALGGREHVEEVADSAALYETLKKILRVVFPFVNDARGILSELVVLLDRASSLQRNSTSSPLPSGDSSPTDSSEPSTPSN